MEDLLFAAYLIGATGLPGGVVGYLVARSRPTSQVAGSLIGTSFGIGALCGAAACVVYGAIAVAESPYLLVVAAFAGVTNFLAGTTAAGVVLARTRE